MPLSTVFQSYHGDSSHYSCLSWVSPVLGWALKCLVQGHSREKTQRIQCCSNPGPLDYESNTLPLSHAGPWSILLIYINKEKLRLVGLRFNATLRKVTDILHNYYDSIGYFMTYSLSSSSSGIPWHFV